MTSTTQNKANIRAYQGTHDEDLYLTQWYFKTVRTGDFERFIPTNIESLFQFLALCQQPTSVLYTLNSAFSITQASMLTPLLSGASINIWTDPSLRGTREHYSFVQQVLNAAFNVWPVLIGFVNQPHLVDLYTKVGFEETDEIPYILNNKPAVIMFMTKQMFDNSRFSKLGGQKDEDI